MFIGIMYPVILYQAHGSNAITRRSFLSSRYIIISGKTLENTGYSLWTKPDIFKKYADAMLFQ